ncbi:RNase adaptor protein for sRNA GlmZ degradation [Pullulanibacillus pueri]|uniref:RapZ C-terminal domain-containing protein n=1 Tax=Pullulanibacillus pueri TaxID=1437324 RepID=A0A8J2ZSR5_9BACL|nr:RNase adaptor protein for sRNA GlmZ degradation [Pullulanibacillus pueri]GGH76076.1 hypothetical protein GCM10007096_05980 [Pullulanibacillus pueri]
MVIAIGCTGGKHRSVALTEYIAEYYKAEANTKIYHRDIEKGKNKNYDKKLT